MSGSTTPHLTIKTSVDVPSDSRTHGYQGPTRNIRLPRACSHGGGSISKASDGQRCAVAGKESLRILRVSDTTQDTNVENYHKFTVGRGGHRIEASKNYWEGSGLKTDSAFTDVAWCHGLYNNKILTSARNGELIMWDLNKAESIKYERRAKDHLRSIHSVCVSPLVPHYCLTGSADGDLRVWDLRDLQRSIIRIHHPTSVRGVVFSPVVFQPLQAVVGLDNGNLFRWDLKAGQRGRLDRIPVAHTAPVTSLDWCSTLPSFPENSGGGHGWLVSGGLDRCVKVWDLTSQHIPHKPTYTLHPSFPVRRVLWRPSYECEIAIVSNADFGTTNNPELNTPVPPVPGLPSALQVPVVASAASSRRSPNLGLGLDFFGGDKDSSASRPKSFSGPSGGTSTPTGSRISVSGPASGTGEAAEIWDVRRGWIAKWNVTGSTVDGGLTDVVFGADSHVIWGQHYSGMFSQIDLRDVTKPIDTVERVAVGWEASGGLAFVADKKDEWEMPYDDVRPQERSMFEVSSTKNKSLGDPSFAPLSQNLGTFQTAESITDNVIFTKLAREYVLEGDDRRQICALNAQVAFNAGHHRAAQVWLLVGASLTNLIPGPTAPQPRPQSPQDDVVDKSMNHSHSAPAALSTIAGNERNGQKSPNRTSDHSSERVISPTSYQQRSVSGGRRNLYTPASSANSSPHQGLSTLPPTPLSTSSRFPHLGGRRNSIDPSSIIRPPSLAKRPSVYRRPSNSTHSVSPSTSSLRHVGEGALDDSDSSSSDGQDRGTHDHDSNGEDDIQEEEEPTALRPLISPALVPLRISQPSPLSRVVGQQRWTEDEDEMGGKEMDEDESPSPRSTDSEMDNTQKGVGKVAGPSSRKKRPHSVRRPSTRRRNSSSATGASAVKLKTRSRSSTLASIQTMVSRKSSTKSLLRHDSLASIKTVTASGDASIRELDERPSSRNLRVEETIKDLRQVTQHNRDKSLVISELVLENQSGQKATVQRSVPLTKRDQGLVAAEEQKYQDMTWDSLREALEAFADDGDVQMCAMLAIIVPRELEIKEQRRLAFIECYIDHLARLRLYICAAYVRRYSRVEDIRSQTLLETTIYTACGRCRKPFIVSPSQSGKTSHTFCLRCRRTTVICSIW
ncbi:wd repeat-containing protein 24 [Moniliophthora roreri MCA 2997]|uniref:Wd repeat-containing protein 24 n=1 Tax=Moniliophthora roreri (strain MCA 2997) TaxID=1381753 RepID=V2XTI1_MONRO|nr:wd repeat-containing protein 24 [Moniliophthora roreri MCA 2997]